MPWATFMPLGQGAPCIEHGFELLLFLHEELTTDRQSH